MKPRTVVLAASVVYAVFYICMSVFLYANLMYSDFDLAVHAQTLWNLVHGSGDSSILGVHFLANHFSPFFYALKYVYAVLPSPLTLLALQSVALASGVFLSYRLAARFVSPAWSIIVALSYFFYPAVGFTNLFEFHPTSLSVPFLFLMILNYMDRKIIPFLIFAALSMSFQENIALGIIMIGLFSLYEKRNMAWSILPILLASTWSYVALFVVQPGLNQGTIQFYRIYEHLGTTLPQIVLSPFLKPAAFFGTVISLQTILYLLKLLAPFLFLPVLDLPRFFILTPFLLQHVLSSRETEQALTYHYAIEMVPYLILSLSAGLCWFLQRLADRLFQKILMFAFIISFFVTGILLSPYLTSLDRLENFSPGETLAQQRRLLSLIPPDAPVVATFRFLPLLSQRKELFSFHHVFMGTYTLSNKRYELPSQVRHALLDMNDDMTFGFKTPDSDKNLAAFFNETPWQAIDSVGNVILLQKSGSPRLEGLFQSDPTEEKLRTELSVSVNDEIMLKSFSLVMGEGTHQGQVGLLFLWKALKKTDRNYRLLVTLVDARGRTVYEWSHPLCYQIYPTKEWRSGEHILEKVWFLMPPKLPKETLEMRAGVYDDEHGLGVFKGEAKDKIDPNGRVKLETFDPY